MKIVTGLDAKACYVCIKEEIHISHIWFTNILITVSICNHNFFHFMHLKTLFIKGVHRFHHTAKGVHREKNIKRLFYLTCDLEQVFFLLLSQFLCLNLNHLQGLGQA